MAFSNLGKTIGAGLDGVTSMISGVGLASEQNETVLLQNDRMDQLGAGAFLSVSQQSVNPLVTGRHQDQRTNAAFDAPASMLTQGERFFIIGSGIWETSYQRMLELESIYLPSIFLNPKMSVFGQLAYHAYMRCDFEVQIIMNATNFQQGALMLAAVPHWACVTDKGEEAYKVSSVAYMTLPHCLLNCNVNNSAAMSFPWLHTRNLKSIHNEIRDIYCLKLIVWSPLTVASGTSTRVAYRVMARMKNLELHGLRPFVPQMMRVIVAPGQGGLNTSNRVGMTPGYDMSLGPEAFPGDTTSAGGMLMTNLDHQMVTPCMIGVFEMNTVNQHPGFLLYQTEVKPEAKPIQYHQVHHPTNLHAISQFYRYWRGDLVYTFQVVCTKFHSGRIMISFVPEITKPLTFEDHMSSSVLMFDINGVTSSTTFRVPFMSETQYRMTGRSTGLLTVWVVNELTAPEVAPHTIEIIVLQSAADNFSFFAPTWESIAQAGGDTELEEDGESQDPPKIDAATVVEDPTMNQSKDGTFPEVKPGKRTHTRKHTDVSTIMGRARLMQAISVTETGKGSATIPIQFTDQNGPLRGLCRMGYMLRGTLRVAVTLNNGSVSGEPDSSLRVGFFPHPLPAKIEYNQFTSVGFVTLNSQEAHNVVLTIPWYTELVAINTWGGDDQIYGHLHLEWFNTHPIYIDVMVAFNDDTQLLFPMPVQVLENYALGVRKEVSLRGRQPVIEMIEVESEGSLGLEIRVAQGPYMVKSGVFVTEVAKKSGMYQEGIRPGDMIVTANDISLMGMSVSEARTCLKEMDRPGKIGFEKFAEQRYGLKVTSKSRNKMAFLGQYDKDDWDEYRELEKQAEATSLCSYSGTMIGHSASESDGFYAQSGDYPLGALIKQVIPGTGMWHYAVSLGSGTIAELVPRDDRFFVWMTEQEGIVQLSPLEGDWLQVGLSPEPELTLRAVCSTIGNSKYNILKYNCETWARTMTMQHGTCQVDRIFKGVLVGSALCMTGSIVASQMIAQAGEEKPTPGPKPKGFSFKKKLASVLDATQTADSASSTIEKVDKVATKADLLVTEIREKLKPENLFKSLTGAKAMKWGSRIMAFILEAVAMSCDIAAIVTTTDHVTRALLISSMGCKMAAGVIGLINCVIDKHKPQSFEPFQVDDDSLLESEEMSQLVGAMIDTCWEKQMGEEFVPQGGVMTLVKDVATVGCAVRSVKDFVGFMKNLLSRFLAWMKPKEEAAIKWKLSEKCNRAIIELTYELTSIKAIDASTPEMKVQKHDEAMKLLKRVQELMKAVQENYEDKKHKGAVSQLSRMASDLVIIIAANRSGQTSVRVEPVVCYLAGKPGTGKSVSANALAWAICKKLGVDPDINIYSKPGGTDFWDGYAGQPVLMYDDIGQATDGKDWEDMCRVISTATLKVNMASLEEKGAEFKTPFIIMTSNNFIPKPNSISTPAAVHRRLTYMVHVEAQGPFQTKDGKLDVNLAKEAKAFKGMMCCKYTEYKIEQSKSGGKDMVVCGESTFPQLVQAIYDTYISKAASLGHMRQMMDMIFEGQSGEEQFEYSEWVNPEEDQLRELRKAEKRKRMKKILVVCGAVTAVVGALGLVVGITALACIKKRDKGECQRAYMVNGKPDIPRIPPNHEMKAQRHIETAAAARKNMVRVGKVDKAGKIVITGNGLFVLQRVMITVKHCVVGGTAVVIEDEDGYHTLEDGDLDMVEVEGDIVALVIKKRSIRERKTLLGSVAGQDDYDKVVGTYAVAYTVDGKVLPFTDIRMVNKFTYPDPNNKGEVIEVPAAFKGIGTAMMGACGAPWVTASTGAGCRIVGMHVAGSDTHSVCQVLDRQLLEKLQKYEPQGKILYVTDAPYRVNSSGRCSIVQTKFAPYLDITKEPAPMGYWDGRALNDPAAQLIKKHASPRLSEPHDWITCESVAMSYIQGVKEAIKREGTDMLTFNEAVYGTSRLEGIDMKTGSGLPWSADKNPFKRKKPYVVQQKEFRIAVDEVRDFILNPYEDRPVPDVYYSVHLKDETLPCSKARAGRTRCISAAPFHVTVSAKMCFGRAVEQIYSTDVLLGKTMGVCVGIDPERAWTRIALHKPDWPVLCLDYSNFDGSLQHWVIVSACRILAEAACLAPECGNRLAELITPSKQIFDDKMYVVEGALPSGTCFTSAIGSLCNYMMVMYTLCKVTGNKMGGFRQWCEVLTYGDDVLCMVHPDVDIDVEQIGTVMWNVFGATVTDANNKNQAPMFRNLSDCTFLKRGFRRCMRCPFLTHPTMDEDGVWSMLAWKKKGSTYPELTRAAAGFMWHYGRKKYDEFCDKMRGLLQVLEGEERALCLMELPPYDDWHSEWMNHP